MSMVMNKDKSCNKTCSGYAELQHRILGELAHMWQSSWLKPKAERFDSSAPHSIKGLNCNSVSNTGWEEQNYLKMKVLRLLNNEPSIIDYFLILIRKRVALWLLLLRL